VNFHASKKVKNRSSIVTERKIFLEILTGIGSQIKFSKNAFAGFYHSLVTGGGAFFSVPTVPQKPRRTINLKFLTNFL